MKKKLSILMSVIMLTSCADEGSIERSMSSTRTVQVESVGHRLKIVTIDSTEYLVNHNGGIIKLEE